MAHDPHHEHLIKELVEQLEPVFSNSPQAIYLYLDDEHKACNQKLAELLGYKSPQEWAANEFPLEDIDPKDQKKAIKSYVEASENFKASVLKAACIKKNGQKVPVEIVMAPITYKNEVFVLHFISEVK